MSKFNVCAGVVASVLLGSGVALAATDGTSDNAPAATSPAPDSRSLLFSTEADQAKPMIAAENAAFAEKLQEIIGKELHRHIKHEEDRAGVEAFYRGRGFAPLWTSKGAPLPRAQQAIEALNGVAADGLDPADYPTPFFADTSPYRVVADELMLTNSVLSFARHASIGRIAFTRVSGSIYFDLKFSAADTLGKLAESNDVRQTLASLFPKHPQYQALKRALARERSGGDAKKADLIASNMERWRWLPRDLGKTYVMVNVPDFTLKVVDGGDTRWSTRIVAGKPGKLETPLLSQPMKYITVNPTWNVPPSIIRNEYLPALQRDPGALARSGLKMGYNRDGSIRIYQPPGARNALGRIRFNFPNKFLVYQHDTPQKHLFDKPSRAFSHGCMRVQHPEQYAQVLLSLTQPEDGYTAERIRSMYGDNERTINFKQHIPVYITYQTAFVDESGQLQTRTDLYGHDKAMARLMKDERQVADVPIKRDYTSSSKPVMARLPSRYNGARESWAMGSRDNWSSSSRDAWGMGSWGGFGGYQGGPRGGFNRFSTW